MFFHFKIYNSKSIKSLSQKINHFKSLYKILSFSQIILIGKKLEALAKSRELALDLLYQIPQTPIIARQNNNHEIIEFLKSHIQELIQNAIGENPNATDEEINMSLELLIFPSTDFSKFLSENEIVIKHIISTMMEQENANRFFINAMRILIFMIYFSHGNILKKIEKEERFYFLKQILTLNDSMILDDLMYAIIDQNIFKDWIYSFDKLSLFYSLLENLLTTPSYSSTYDRIITFYQKFLIIFKGDKIEQFENPIICESLFNIGVNFSSLNSLKVINYILKKNSCTKDEDKLNGLFGLIDQNINFFLEVVMESQSDDGSYLFGPFQKESLSIITYFLQYGNLDFEQVDWSFDVAGFLWEQFLSNTTNSFLHNAYLSYFRQIIKYEANFVDFIREGDFLNIIPDIFTKRSIMQASFFGQLLEISKILNSFLESHKSIEIGQSWTQFTKIFLGCYIENIEAIKNAKHADDEVGCYKHDAGNHLRDCLDKDTIDNEVSVPKDDSSSYDYVSIEEEEEEEEEFNENDGWF